MASGEYFGYLFLYIVFVFFCMMGLLTGGHFCNGLGGVLLVLILYIFFIFSCMMGLLTGRHFRIGLGGVLWY